MSTGTISVLMTDRTISVVSVWYNQVEYLPKFVDCLLHQSCQDFEAIFVDDGSADGLGAAIEATCEEVGLDWVYIRRSDRGFTLNSSRNDGLGVARSNRVLLLDGDMLPSSTLIERHIANLENGVQCSVGSRIRSPHLGVASDERYHVFQDGSWSAKPFLYAFGCNLALDKKFLDRHGLKFDESFDGLYGMDDIDFAYRCHESGAMFAYDVYASATHVPVDHPDVNKLSQSLVNYERFRSYHFTGGIVQSGPVFFEHKYNAELYRRIIGGDVGTGSHVMRISSAPNAKKGTAVVKEIGHGKPTFIIAEAGLNHNGSFDIAKRMIEIAALAGADCVKFQRRDVDQMATSVVYDTTPSPFRELGETYRDVRERHELTLDEFAKLKEITEQHGLVFMITPFDLQSVDVCEQLEVGCYKVASHSMTDFPMLRRVAETKKPLFLSTGMSTADEVDLAVAEIRKCHSDFVLMHCVSSYPQKDEDTKMSLIDYLRDRYSCLVGYSGHEEGTVVSAAAVFKNVTAIERHFTLDKKMIGFDHGLSLSPQELLTLCQDIRTVEKAIGTPEKRVLASEQVSRDSYRRSLVSVRSLMKGHVLVETDVTVKEPGTGIPPYAIERYLGRKLVTDVGPDVTLVDRHFEGSGSSGL